MPHTLQHRQFREGDVEIFVTIESVDGIGWRPKHLLIRRPQTADWHRDDLLKVFGGFTSQESAAAAGRQAALKALAGG